MKHAKIVAVVLVPASFFFAAYHAWGFFIAASQPLVVEPVYAEQLAASATAEPEFVDTTNPNDLLPDLLPLPPRDLKVEKIGNQVLLYFSTTYYNQGRGTLELRADPATAGLRETIERNVLQRVYQADGAHRDKPVGTFLWHQEHLHYHYTDFITYDLEPVGAPKNEELSGNLVKSTFCLRDVSRVFLDLASSSPEATYKICGKELQGVSVGWGDTYYWNYPDQALDITGLESGTYRLTFVANPEKRLEEIRYDNNISSALFRLNMDTATVDVLEENPKETPEVEHIHLDSPFGM
ncbi:hypothetical protein A3F55_02345 [Candidatus Adlerbacteria bacterium RIFCSPHIGHO2_12_FULL_53_18]|uniref:Lysyl oxidase n=1 Tax=Candidatus Adlerbacteria bacterium RIFCSPHIGHO2_12_FULL_53_18 TaxID=1797242 RepID=A0A1F4XSN2_9BACT|nr:MAG: hypothetical protein A3F55_02345 [Candidatus Adlerbacteria bacterium RIFCSPHIGHO2_12_FULL_53_18]